jgi:hypothetical protein
MSNAHNKNIQTGILQGSVLAPAVFFKFIKMFQMILIRIIQKKAFYFINRGFDFERIVIMKKKILLTDPQKQSNGSASIFHCFTRKVNAKTYF